MYTPIKDLSDEKFWKLMKAIFHYQENWEEKKLDDDLKMAFLFFKNQFDIDNQKYESICKKRQEQGKKWGLAKATKSYQKLPKSSKSSLKDKEKEKDKDKEKDINKISKDIVQSTEIEKVDKRVIEIDIIIETLKELNWWIIDDTVKQQRIMWKNIKNKIEKIHWFNGDYYWFIRALYEYSDEYRKQYFRSCEKFYYNIAWIIAWIKSKKQQEQKSDIINII